MPDDDIVRSALLPCRAVDPSAAERAAEFSAADLRNGPERTVRLGPVSVSTVRRTGDAPDVRRLIVEFPDGEIELQPTKGLTIGPYVFDGWRPFWEPVVPDIISPDAERLLGEVLVHGHAVGALRWLENFSGCVELLGLSNWGMPRRHRESGVTLPLHGEVARIPVDRASVDAREDCVVISGELSVNSMWWRRPEDDRPWYLRGRPDWRITRTVIAEYGSGRLQFVDRIENVGAEPSAPEWGYHVQLRAETGARLLIPSRMTTRRAGGPAEDGFREWVPAEEPGKRVERGYVHRGLTPEPGPFDTGLVRGAATYPDGTATLFTMPVAAYTLSWFSSGGKGGLEFVLPEYPGTGISRIAWDGMGPEIGTSPLDHDGTIDHEITHRVLRPGESTRLYFSIERADARAAADLIAPGARQEPGVPTSAASRSLNDAKIVQFAANTRHPACAFR